MFDACPPDPRRDAALDRFDNLNMAQVRAVRYGSGPVLVVAGPGSGKTLTLACRVAHLVSSGVPPERILLLTFTRRAAREMLGRARRLLGREDVTARVWGGTFHATANRLLRTHGRPLGIQPDFTIMDQADAADLMNLIRGDLGLGRGRRRFPRKETLAAIYSRTINAGAPLDHVLDRAFPWCRDEIDGIRAIFQRYTERKRERNVLDYDDLLLYWKALAQTPGAGRGQDLAMLFDHVLVDEYQDTNALQADILRGMRPEGTNLMVVGDDSQAIYSFRSATNRNILEFVDRFPGAGLVKLEQNYRSTTTILDASNAVIALSTERHDKAMWSERPSAQRPILTTCLDESEQSDAVCRHLLEHRERGVPLRHQAVLFRAAHHSDLLEVELARRNIPFVKYGGLKFLEAAHVKDVLAFLRVLENPTDEVSWFRVLQLLEGVGPATARRLMADLGLHDIDGGTGSPSPLARLIESPPPAPPTVTGPLAELAQAAADCLEPGLPPAAQIERARRFLEPAFVRLYENARERLRDVEQLANLATSYSTRGRFIAELTLDPPNSTGDLAGPPLLDEDYVVLSTIHSAKGLEWDVVHVIHAADGMIPSDMATGSAEETEEERRLFYVAMTRARDMLYVYFPLRYYHRPRGVTDAHNYAQLTRFLPESIRSWFEERVESSVQADEPLGDEAATAGRQPAMVTEYLGSLWGP